MMHVVSNKAGGDQIVIGSTWINQYDNVTVENRWKGGSHMGNEAVVVFGLPVACQGDGTT